jgi:hypothetical protein
LLRLEIRHRPSPGRAQKLWASQSGKVLVGVGRFELPTPCSRSRCATRLRYTPKSLRRAVYRRVGQTPQENPRPAAGSKRWSSRPLPQARDAGRRAATHLMAWVPAENWRKRGSSHQVEQIGAWPSGKATGFGPVIPGSNPGAPATLQVIDTDELSVAWTGAISREIRCLFCGTAGVTGRDNSGRTRADPDKKISQAAFWGQDRARRTPVEGRRVPTYPF